MKRAEQGFTILELVLAMAVLAVGVLAAVGLQTGSLNSTSAAQRREQAVVLARNEMDYQRSLSRVGSGNAYATPACSSVSGGAYTCTVTVAPCDLVSGSFSCATASTAASAAVADQIRVTVTWDSRAVALDTITARL